MKVVMSDATRLNTSFDLKPLPSLYVSECSRTIFLYFREFGARSAESSATKSVKICSTRTACKVSKRRFIPYFVVRCRDRPDICQRSGLISFPVGFWISGRLSQEWIPDITKAGYPGHP